MPNAELSEILFIAMMFIVVSIISTVSIYLFVRQFNREKADSQYQGQKKNSPSVETAEVEKSEPETKSL